MAYPSLVENGDSNIARIRRPHLMPSPTFGYSSRFNPAPLCLVKLSKRQRMRELLPTTNLLVLFILLGIAAFENQRWVGARARGLGVSNERFRLYVNLTGGLAFLFSLAFLSAYWYDAGVVEAVVLFVISVAANTIYAFVSGSILRGRGENPVFWIAGTIAMWIIPLFLIPQLTWIGLL